MTKGRLRIIRLAICVFLIAAAVSAVNAGKNPLVKKILTSGLQNIFGAKAEIGHVDLRLLDSSLVIRKTAVADKDNPMQNLFEVENAVLDFDLVNLLTGKFVTELGEITGITYGTPRSTSGALPENEKYVVERAVKKKFETKRDEILAALENKAKADVASLLGTYNPETFMQETLSSLKTPEMKDEIIEKMHQLNSDWKTEIAETKNEISLFEERLEKLSETDLDRLTPAAVKELAGNVKDTVDSVKTMQKKAETIQTRFTEDTEAIRKLAADFNASMEYDTKFVGNKISSIKVPDIKDGENFVSGYLNTACMQLLGKWYPVFTDAMETAREFQQSGKSLNIPKKKKEPKRLVKRAEGRTVTYSRKLPTFLIKELRIGGSAPDGKLAAEGFILNISNNADLVESPVSGEIALTRGNFRENISFAGDFRTEPEKNMLEVNFRGGSYPVNMDGSGISMAGKGSAEGGIYYGRDGKTVLGGKLDLAELTLASAAFEPDFIFDLYSRVMAEIKSAVIDAEMEFDPEKELDLRLETDIDRQIAQGLRKVMTEEINSVKQKLETEVNGKLAGIRSEFEARKGEYELLKSEIGRNVASLRNLETRLAEKQKELEKQALKSLIRKF